jgi:hypothetical protein
LRRPFHFEPTSRALGEVAKLDCSIAKTLAVVGDR